MGMTGDLPGSIDAPLIDRAALRRRRLATAVLVIAVTIVVVVALFTLGAQVFADPMAGT